LALKAALVGALLEPCWRVPLEMLVEM
jgi:hypothetical protein